MPCHAMLSYDTLYCHNCNDAYAYVDAYAYIDADAQVLRCFRDLESSW